MRGTGTVTSSTSRIHEKTLTDAGFRITGRSPDGKYVEIVEAPDHPWFLACQFHPEFKSKPLAPHPLFLAFIGAALAHQSAELRQFGDWQYQRRVRVGQTFPSQLAYRIWP